MAASDSAGRRGFFAGDRVESIRMLSSSADPAYACWSSRSSRSIDLGARAVQAGMVVSEPASVRRQGCSTA